MRSRPPSAFVNQAIRRRLRAQQMPVIRVKEGIPKGLKDPAYVTHSAYAHLEAIGYATSGNGTVPEVISCEELEALVRKAPTVEELEKLGPGRPWYDGTAYRLALAGLERLAEHPEEIDVRDPERFFETVAGDVPAIDRLEATWEQKRWAHAAAVRIADAYL